MTKSEILTKIYEVNKARNSIEIKLENTVKGFSDTQEVEIKVDVQSILYFKSFYVKLALSGPEHFDLMRLDFIC